ncbi:MAG: Mov34/MPN/PAD-1 family protein [Candidatus Hodarchaeota archaeon]
MHEIDEIVNDSEQKQENDREKNHFITVWILDRIKDEIYDYCKQNMPNEAIGVLIGYRLSYEGQKYIKIVDWTTGEAEMGLTFARFTEEGVRQYSLFLDERYGSDNGFKDKKSDRPRVVGIFHSHPFGINPAFSATDYNTFLNFPYDAEHNVFILIDPKIDVFKCFQVQKKNHVKNLVQVVWGEYGIQ